MSIDPSRRLPAPALLGLLIASISGCGTAGDAIPARAETKAEAPALRVAVVNPERMSLRRVASEPGQVEAFETTEVHARIAGYVRRMAVDIGDRVEAGQVLAELEVPELVAEFERRAAHLDQDVADLKRAEAMVEVAVAAVATAEARVEESRAAIRRTAADVARWEAEYNRIDRLVNERAVTESLRDETRSKLEAARASVDEAEANVRLAAAARIQAQAELARAHADVEVGRAHVRVAEADARHAEAMVGFSRIVAPFDGAITHRHVDSGHLTEPGGARDPLLTIARTDTVRVSVGVPEVDAPLVDVGDRAEIRVQALGGRTFEGAVSRISWALDRATRTLRAEVDLENPDALLQPGLYVYATIVAAERDDVLTLPASAVLRDRDGVTSCVVVLDGRAERRAIEVGLSDGQRIEVVSGLSGDELVVTADPGSLEDGQAVDATEPA